MMWRHLAQETTGDFSPCTEERSTCTFTVISESSLLLITSLTESQLQSNKSYVSCLGGTHTGTVIEVFQAHDVNACLPDALCPEKALSRLWPLGWLLGLFQFC